MGQTQTRQPVATLPDDLIWKPLLKAKITTEKFAGVSSTKRTMVSIEDYFHKMTFSEQMARKLKDVFRVAEQDLPKDTKICLYDGIVICSQHMDAPVRILARELYQAWHIIL